MDFMESKAIVTAIRVGFTTTACISRFLPERITE